VRYFLKAVIKRAAAARIYPRHFYHLYKYIRRTPQTLLEYFELRDHYKLHAGKLHLRLKNKRTSDALFL